MKPNVFYIEQEKFLRTMFEIAFKNQDKEIYTIDTLVGNEYLLEDLAPTIIIFDVKTVGAQITKILSYQKSSLLIATGDPEDESLVKDSVKFFIKKPIIALDLVNTILGFALE